MTYFNFNLLSTRRYGAPGAPTDDTSALVMSLDDEPQIDVVAILERCGTPAILMIGSETLTESEVETMLAEKFKATGRELSDYVDSEPETEGY
jgi:hypothetical protein